MRVHASLTPFWAHFFRSILGAEGIDAEIRQEEMVGLAGALPVDICLVEVWVKQADEARARTLLEGQPNGTLEQRCKDCGETNPPGFEICWKCDRVLVA